MTLLLKQFFAFFKILNSETGHNQIASGIAVGLILGFAPMLSLQALFILVCLFVFRIQAGAAFLAAFFFKMIAWTLDGPADSLGQWILEAPSLRPLFVDMYNMPLVPLTRFNNSIIMGSAAISLVLCPFLFFIARYIILKYRVHIVARFKESKIWKLWAASALHKWYSTYSSLYGG